MRTIDERLEDVERAVALLVSPPPMDAGGGAGRVAMVDHGAPGVGAPVPARWRSLAATECEHHWRDLFQWVEWMLEAFDVHMSREAEGMWWTSAGATEELSALRDWHRELADVEISALAPDPVAALSRPAAVAFERGERTVRSLQARDLVSWHEARGRACERLFGSSGQPLMVGRAEASAVARERAEGLRKRRGKEFAGFLAAPALPPPPTE